MTNYEKCIKECDKKGYSGYIDKREKRLECLKKHKPKEYQEYLDHMDRMSDALIDSPRGEYDIKPTGRDYGLLFE